MELTQDPYVIILRRGPQFILYYNVVTDRSWIIYGECSHNGSCIDGAINPDLRHWTLRKDIPCIPESDGHVDCEGCNLRGVYCDGD